MMQQSLSHSGQHPGQHLGQPKQPPLPPQTQQPQQQKTQQQPQQMMRHITPPPEAPKPVVSAAAAKDLAKKLSSIMAELCKVMEEETPIILARDYTKQSNFIQRKQELTLDYQSVMKVFAENTPLLNSLSKEDVIQLRNDGKKLDDLANKNAQALRFAHHASENVLKVVINEIRKDMHKQSGYSGRGVMALAEVSKARPISINQRV